jgi:uncharacterized surface anchored protein
MKNIKKINLNKKIVAILLLLITLISNISPVFAVSSSGTGQWVAGQWDSNVYTTENNSGVGMLLRRLVNNTTKERITVFCAEHGVDCTTGTIHTATHLVPTDEKVKRACKVAYFGWYSKYGDYVIDGGIMAESMKSRKMDYVYTQQYIWETLEQNHATFKDSSIQSGYINFKNDINNKINAMQTRPSFDGTIVTIDAGDTKTLTDTNGVLADYCSIDNTKDNVRFQHTKGENTLTITVPDNCNVERINISDNTFKEWGMIKEESRDQDTTIYFSFANGVQNQLMALHYNDPVPMAMSVQINLTGKLELTKLDTNHNLINGAVFNITGPNGYNQDVTVANGKILVENLKKGTYTIKEKTAPTGYILNTQSYNVEIKTNETTTQIIENAEPTGTIEIHKRDKETKTVPQGDAVFLNAEYKVYADEDIYNVARTLKYYSKNDVVATIYVDEKGDGQVSDLPMGKYYVKETRQPEGYFIDEEIYRVTLSYLNQETPVIYKSVISNEQVKKQRIHVFKSGIDINSGVTPGLEGSQFTIKLEKDVKVALAKGYTYEEIWDGVDKLGNKVTVDKERAKEAQKIAKTYEIITTDNEGNAYTQKALPYGKYIMKETYTPEDYESVTDITFRITQDESEIQEIAKKVKTIVANDEQLETYIRLIKKDLKTGKNVTLNSATFQIIPTEDVYDRATKTILHQKGKPVMQKIGSTTYNSFTTNADNLIVPKQSYNNTTTDGKGTTTLPLKLEVGSYKITEIQLPEGFLVLDEPVYFDVENIRGNEQDEDGDFIQEVIIKNEQPTGKIELDKFIALRDNVDTSLVDTSDLSNIQFTLTASENIIDMADGSTIYKEGQVVGVYTLDKKGYLTIDEIPMGKYYLQEIKTMNGLVLNRNKFEVEFVKQDDTTKVYEKVQKVTNDTTLVEISKTDITGEKELEGAKLTIIDSEGNVIDSWTSTNDSHKIEGLTVGKTYTLKEEIAPKGYVRASEIQFKIEDTSEAQKVVMIDKIVDMTKSDIAGDEVEGAKMQVFDKEGKLVDEWISGKEAHKIENLVEGEKYTLHEETAPEGYVLATDIEFEVTFEKETQHENMTDKVVEMSKVDIGGEEIEGATIQVKDKDNKVIDEWVSGKEPHKISNLKEGETYTLHEEITAKGYVKASDTTFTVSLDKETQHEKMIDKIVEITKENVDGELIEGAKMQVFDNEGNLVDEWISGKEAHRVENLVEGASYTLHEETVPEGYVKAKDEKFEVTLDKDNQKIVMIDKMLSVTKTDLTDGTELEGAELTVTDEDGNVIDKWTSTKEPHVINGLEEGKKYTLTEITAPYGYEFTESIEFEVSFDKENQLVEMKDMPILKSVQVEKLDKDTKEHIKSNKFVFGIYEDAECTKLIREVGANEYEGTALFDNLKYGVYYIKEVKAPTGYKLSDQIVKIEINDKGVFADGVSLEEKDDIYSFEYYNSLLPKIQTGNETNYFLLGSVAVISLIGAIGGIILLRKKHNEK